MGICVSVWLYACECSAHRGQKRVLDLLELELEETVICGFWELNSEPLGEGLAQYTCSYTFLPHPFFPQDSEYLTV